MADLSHLDGAALENPDRISDSVKNNMVTGTTVKSLDTGHTEASLKNHMSKEMELLAIGNGNFFMNLLDGLLGELIDLIKRFLKDPLSVVEDGVDLLVKVGGGALALGFGLGEALFGFLSDIGGTIVSLFTNEPRQLAPGFSELRANLEADVAPFMESFKKNGENAAEALGKVGVLREEVEQTIIIVERDIRSAENALAAIGDVDKKIADQALIHIRDSEAALEEAKGAMEALAAYKDVVDPKIRSALADSQDGLGRLDALEPQVEAATKDLSDYKALIGPKIQDALADSQAGLDRLGTLEPKVSTVIADLDAYEKATNAKIQDLLGKASGAITDAGQALTQYDDLLSEYEGFKTEASGSLEALRKSSTTQGQKLGVIEDDMPGIKTSITNVFALAETAQETVDNLQIGGRNLARRRDLAGSSSYQTIVDTGETFWTGEPIYYGEKLTSGTPPTSLHRSIRIEPGETYTVSMWIRGETDSGKTNANILFYDTGLLQSYASTRTGDPASEWHLISGTVHNDTDAAYEKVIPYFYINRNPGDKTWFTSPKLERGNKATDWTPAPEDVEADIAAAREKADQATLDAASKAEDARIAAELYAKEKSEADVALAEERAAAEAARVAKAEADAAKTAAATDATNKADEAERLAKLHADTQANAAREAAEATAALDATTKANKAKADAEKEAKRLSDIAAAAAATAQATANQAKADAESKANAAREAAEKYAKEKSEADAAQALVDATAEAARVAQEAAAQAVLDSASDADTKVALAETALKAYTDAQAAAAQEAAEATAALDATTKANKAKADAEANAKKLSDAAAASAAAAQSTANQAKLDATNKAAAAQTAAEKYAKEKAEAERAIAEENAAAEALRVAQQEANAAKTAAATDAKAKADEAERLAKLHADAQAALAKEQAEATAALDATTKANKAKADAEANAKILSDKAQKLAEEVKFTADTTAGKIPGMQDSITTAHGKAEAAKGYAEHVSQRGDNLVLNGFGELGDNTYFNSFTYVADDAPLGVAGSFQIGGGGASFSERVPVDLTQELTVSCYLKKASDLNQRVYFSVEPYDADGFMISPQNWMETAGTRAQLARPLKKGDTELHLVDADSAAWAGSNMRGLIVWNYTDSRGKTWEPGTYSRNYQSSTYDPEGVNGNVITLTKPWGGVDAEAGTWVGCGRSGGTYLYPFTYTIDHTDWRYYEGVVGGSVASGTSVGNGMPAATVAIRPRFLLTPTSGPVRVAGISMSYRKTAIRKAAAAQEKADQATLDAEEKATAARIAAELYAKEKSEADVALAEERAAAEAARVAKAEADAAKTAAATDATNKADEAERLAKLHADTQANAAREAAEATAALDATTKANKAKADAEKEAKRLSDIAAAAAATAQATANQAKADAESKAAAAQTAAQKYAKEKSEADAAQALVDAKAEAARLAKAAADQAVLDSASDADDKVALAEAALKAYADAQAEAAQEAAEATAALDATTKANKAKADAEKEAKRLSDIAAAAAATAQATANQAKADAESKAAAAQTAAQKYAKEKSEADVAASLVTSAAEALRVAKLQADAAKTAAATDAKAKADEAERLAKLHADAQAALAKEQAEATAALDATTKANKAKKDAEANAKVLSDKAQKLAEEVKFTADTTAGKIPGMQDAITTAHGKAEEVQRNLDNLEIGGRNLATRRNFALNSQHQQVKDTGEVFWTGEPVYHGLKLTTSTPPVALSSGLRVEPGETYTASLWVKGASLEGSMNCNVLMYDTEARQSRAGGAVSGDGSEWRRLVVTVTNDTAEAFPNISPYFYLNRNAGEETWFTSPKVERGNRPTDWTPAPEDVEAEIAAAVQTSADALNTYRTANDKAVSDANDAAAAAAGVAQAKGEVIYQSAAPTGARATKANLWIRTSDNKPHTYNGTKWVEVTDKVAADAADKAATALSTAQAKTTTYYGSSTPTGAKTAGDLWLDSGSDNALKRWSGSAWVVVRDGQLAKALKAAGDAQSTADGKVRSFAQSTAPTGMTTTDVGDIWLDTDDGNKMYRWSGTSWVTMQDHLAVQAKSVADAATTKAETAQSTVDNLEIGGRNLVFGSAVEQVKTVPGTSIFMLPVNVGALQGAVGKVITLSFDARSDVEGYSGDIYVRNDAASRLISTFGNFSITTKKQRYEFQVTLASGVLDSDRLSLAIRASATGTMWISNLKLERGDKATDWSPAPEDVDKNIADVDYKATETGKLIPGIQDSLATAHGKAETAQSTVDNLKVGGRNLLRNSKLDIRNKDYQIARVDLAAGHDLQANETVTLAIKGQLGAGKTQLSVYNSQTAYSWLRIDAADQDADGVYRVTAPFSANQVNSHLFLYTVPSTVTTESSIEWIKLERGNKATDWSPAPEDVDKSIADVDYKASETGKLIPGMQDSLNIAHSKAETAQSTVDNLQIGGRNLRRNSNDFSQYGTIYGAVRDEIEEGVEVPEWGATDATRMKYTRGTSSLVSTPSISYLPGETVTFSYWLKNVGTVPLRIGYNGLSPHIREDYEPGFSGRVTFTGVLREDYSWFQHQFYSLQEDADAGNTTIEFVLWRAKLEVGTKATDWTPAPEDVEAEIQAQASALAGYQLSNDTAVDAAKKAAQDAAGLAGGKGEVIYSTTTPPTAKRSAANLWIKGPKNTPHVWNGSAWVEITDQAAKDAAKAAADANSLAETKTTTYYQTSAPSVTKTVGDLWIDQSTAGKNTLKRWSGSAWVVVQDKAIAEAMAAAGTAQSTADEKVRTFARTTAPTGMKSEHVGDLWIDTDDGNKLYRWTGSVWVGVQDAAIAAAKKAADDAAESQRIKDTRNDNEPPSYYWANYTRTTVREFKYLTTVGAGTTGYGVMTTMVPWTDSSGGAITQEFNVNNSDTVMHRRSTGAGATATWTAWKNRDKDLADSITSLGNDLATKTGPNSTLQKNINSLDEATGKQYEDLNKQLWGDQGELNKLNSLLWDDQGKLNQATEIFKSNINGWKKDVYNAFVDFDKTNKYQDGLVAANNRAIAANTQAVSAHQRILQVAYPDSGSAIPMVPGGVNVGTADAPEYEAMPEWLNAYGVTKVAGTDGMDDKRAAHSKTARTVNVSGTTKVKVNPTALYRYSFWAYAGAAGSEMFIRLYGQDGKGAVLENTPDAGMPTPRTSGNHLYWFNANVPTTWKKISGTIRLNPDVTHVYISGIGLNYTGTITSQWVTDIQLEPIIPSQSEVNRALSEVNDAQTAILSSQQDVLDMAFPNTNLVPMVNGVPVWASTVGANPVRTTEGNWRFTSATAVQPGTGGKHVPTVNGVVYRAIARVRTTGSGGTFSVRIRKAGGTTNASLTAVTGKPAPAGASRLNFLSANQTAGAGWTTWYYDFTLANNTGDVRIGYVIGSTGVEVSQLSVVALLPDQTEVNRINNEINTTQNDVLHDHQRALDLMYPADNIVPRDPAGLNVGTEAKPQYVEFPYWLKNGIYSVQPAGSLPAGNRLSARVTTTTTPNTIGPRASVTPGVDYNYEFYFKATAANSGLVIYLVDQNGTVGPGEWNVADGGYSTSSTHLWWNGNMPGGTGPETGGFHRMSGKIRFKPGVTGISIERIYYNWSTGAVTTTQELTGIRIWPDIPSQQQVDEAQNEAIEANKKAISLAFPDMNLDPQTSAGHPEWSTPSTVTVKTTGSLGARNPSYELKGRVNGGFMQLQSDVREYRIRGWITPGPGTNPFVYIYILNENGDQLIEAWRPTFPVAATQEEELAGSDEVQWNTRNFALFSLNDGNAGYPGEWEEMDIVVRLRPGDTVGRIQLYSMSDRWVALSDFRVTAFAPSQWQVDYSQNKALSGLAHSISVQNEAQGELEKAIGPNGLGGQVEDLEKTIREVQSYIPRSMVMNLGASTPKFENDHFIVHNNSGDVKIEALGGDTGWTGHAIFTYVYGTSHETDIVEFKIPDTADGSRNKVRTTQSRTWRRMARLDYWVDNGEQVTKKIAKSPNTDMPSGWSTRTDMTFVALETGFHIVNFKAEWPYTARNGVEYGVRIKRNGTVVNTLTEKNIGPTFPWENGRRTQSINWSGQLTKGQTLTFEVYATGSTKKWRTLGKEERRVSWVSK